MVAMPVLLAATLHPAPNLIARQEGCPVDTGAAMVNGCTVAAAEACGKAEKLCCHF
jgi:hypothetical protein